MGRNYYNAQNPVLFPSTAPQRTAQKNCFGKSYLVNIYIGFFILHIRIVLLLKQDPRELKDQYRRR